MFRKTWFPTLTKHQISRSRGGEKHNFYYLVGISETSESNILTSITYVKLRNQMATQRSLRFPEGYEPFQASSGTAKFCLRTMTIPVPRLKLCSTSWPNPTLAPKIVKERRSACVLNPSSGTEAHHALLAEAEVFEIKHRIRHHAAVSRARLDLALSLMAYEGGGPLLSDPADRFEAYLCLRGSDFLRELLALLDYAGTCREIDRAGIAAGGIKLGEPRKVSEAP
jgi:hypothetical protein